MFDIVLSSLFVRWEEIANRVLTFLDEPMKTTRDQTGRRLATHLIKLYNFI